MEEYARRAVSWVWFRPITPPTILLRDAMISKKVGVELRREDIIISGAIFCHVASRMQMDQEALAITEGNQKCTGAAPSLIAKARLRIVRGISGSEVMFWEMTIYLIRNSLLPRA